MIDWLQIQLRPARAALGTLLGIGFGRVPLRRRNPGREGRDVELPGLSNCLIITAMTTVRPGVPLIGFVSGCDGMWSGVGR